MSSNHRRLVRMQDHAPDGVTKILGIYYALETNSVWVRSDYS